MRLHENDLTTTPTRNRLKSDQEESRPMATQVPSYETPIVVVEGSCPEFPDEDWIVSGLCASGKLDSTTTHVNRPDVDESCLKEVSNFFDIDTNLPNPKNELEEKAVLMFNEITANSLSELSPTDAITHSIKLEDSRPIRQKIRTIPGHKLEEVKKMINEMEVAGLIVKSNSPWLSPVHVVGKSDGSVRITIDYRRLNSVTVKDAYPLPNINGLFARLSSACIFSKIDLSSGYYQIRMDRNSTKYTAFGCEFGLYEYRVMPMGLCNACATFQRAMNQIFADYIGHFVLIYLDDILVYSSNLNDHLKHLELVCDRLKKFGLKVKGTKCEFFRDSVKFLGHVVGLGEIRPDPAKIEALYQFKVPRRLVQVQSFLGLATYYKKFIKDFASIASPLYSVKETNKILAWNDKCQDAFDALREALAGPSVLALPDFSKPFLLESDASNYGVGAVLSQQSDFGVVKPVAYFSRHLVKAELNYTVSEKELYAIVLGVEYFKHFLYGRPFTVLTDHRPLKWLFTKARPASRLARWIEKLNNFEFDIVYREGRKNGNADGLSRLPDAPEDIEPNNPEVQEEFIINAIEIQPKTTLFALTDQNFDDQLNDPDVKWIFDLITTHGIARPDNVKPESDAQKIFLDEYENLQIHGNNLYRKLDMESDRRSVIQYVVPKDQVPIVLDQCHNSIMSGHLGNKKTWNRVQERFFWPNCRRDVQNHVSKCPVCQKIKPSIKNVGPLKPIKSTGPSQILTMDVIGPFPETSRGSKYALTLCDHFTKWGSAYPMPDQQAETVSDQLLDYISIFGLPESILTDQGSNFMSDTLSCLYDLLDIRQLRTSPYHPECNGITERFNQTLKNMITAFINENQTDWDLLLKRLTFAYNSAVHSTTEYSPFELTFGRLPKIPIDLVFPTQDPAKNVVDEIVGYDSYVDKVKLELQQTFETVRNVREVKLSKVKIYHDRNLRAARYEIGDLVLLADKALKKGKNKKLMPRWIGPFRVKSRKGELNYEIVRDGSSKRKIVHINRLKRFRGEDPANKSAKKSLGTSTSDLEQYIALGDGEQVV